MHIKGQRIKSHTCKYINNTCWYIHILDCQKYTSTCTTDYNTEDNKKEISVHIKGQGYNRTIV